MKKIISRYSFIFFLCFIFTHTTAQISVNTVVVPPYQSRIAEYASNPQLMVITLTNMSTVAQEVQLTASITGDNGISAWVKPGFRSPRPLSVAPGQTINLNGNDIAFLFDINKIEYTGISRADMTRGLGLLEGNYRLCIRALDYKSLAPISLEQTGCSQFRISDLEPPRILMPFNKQKIDNKGVQAIPISWSTPSGSSPETQYKVKIVEMIAPRNPNDAIQSTRPLIEETVTGNMLVYGPSSPPLIAGREYAMIVQAVDPSLRSKFRNNGVSEVSTFVYGNNGIDVGGNLKVIKSSLLPYNADCGCKFNVPNNGASANVQIGSIVKVNHFDMNVTKVQSSDGNFSGEGTIVLPALGPVSKAIKLRVVFQNIQVQSFNGEVRLVNGQVLGKVKSDYGVMPNMDQPNLNTIPLTSSEINQIDQYFNNNRQQLLSNLENSANSLGFELPLGIDKGAFTIGVTNVTFDPTQSWFEAVSVMNMADANMKVAFSGRGICIQADNFCKEAELYLSEDAILGTTGLKLLGGENDDATKIIFDKEGFKELVIGGKYTFSGNAVLQDAETGQPLEAILKGRTAKGWSNWIAEAKVRPFKIGGNSDFIFGKGEGTTIIYDHSDISKANGMPDKFESGDAADAPIMIGKEWTGFYIPTIAVQIPGAITKIGGQKLDIEVQHLIFDGGLTGRLTANNVLTLGNGSLDGWFVSIDQISLNFWKNSFKASSMTGKVVLPPSGKDFLSPINQIDYTCTLTKPAGQGLAFEMNATPKGNIEFNALWTTVSITNASKITVKAGGGEKFSATAILHGSMVLKTDIDKLPDLTLGTLTFQNMKISTQKDPEYFSPGQIDFSTGPGQNAYIPDYSNPYAYQETKGPNLYNKDFSLSNPSAGGGGSVIGFSITETSITPYIEGGDIGFRFGGSLQLVKGVNFIPKATVAFAVFGGLDDAAQGGRKFWKSIRGKLEHVKLDVEAKLGPVAVEGTLYYQDIESNGVIDRGLGARIDARLPAFGTGIGMQALFGSRHTTSKSFNYFYLDASLELPAPGITMFPGTAIHGFSGGFYYNMDVAAPPVKDNLQVKDMGKSDNVDKDNPSKVQITSFSGLTYVPQGADVEGANFGIMAGVYFGLASRNTLEALLALDIGLNSSRGFKHFNLEGKAAIMSGNQSSFLERYNNALANADMYLRIEMDPADGKFKQFVTGAKYKLRYPIATPLVKSEGGFEFYIDRYNQWYFHMGKPSMPNKIEFLEFINAESYFQIGNYKLDGMPPIPDRIREIMNGGNSKSLTDNDNSFDKGPATMKKSRNEQEMSLGSGFNFGAKVEISADPKFLIFYASIYAGLGFDVQLSQLTKSNENCGQQKGDWYARGQAFVGAEAACGVRINVFGMQKNIEFLRAGLAATMDMGGPSPLFATGQLAGYFRILDGLISGRFGIKVTLGEACFDNTSRELKLISDLTPGGNDVNLMTKPAVAFNYPLNRDFVVPITTTDEDGNIKSVNYEVYRFRKDYVDIRFKKGTDNVYSSADFTEADETGALSSTQARHYPVYMLALKDDKNVLDRLTEYKLEVDANVKVLKVSLSGGDNAKKSFANQVASNNTTAENEFTFVKSESGLGDYIDRRDTSFMTNAGPKKLPLDLLSDIMPIHRHAALPYNVLPNGDGYVKLSAGLNAKHFDSQLQNPMLFSRVVSAGGSEDVKIDVPIQLEDGDKTWRFKMPALLPNQKYAIRYFLKGQTPPANNPSDKSGTKLQQIASLKVGDKVSDVAKVNSRTIITSSLQMKANEQELFSWYFSTGNHRTYSEKLNKLSLEYLNVNGKRIDIKTPEINLQNFASYGADINLMSLGIDYDYFGNEYFNKLDDGDWRVKDVFPNIGNSNGNKLLSNKKYVGYLPELSAEIPEADRIFREFIDIAFRGQKEMNIVMIETPWSALVGGLSTTYSSEFPYMSPLLGLDLYGINYTENNYGIAPQVENTQIEEQDETTEQTAVLNIAARSIGISSSLANRVNMASSVSVLNMKKHVFSTNYGTHHSSGQGVVNVSNQFLNLVNAKKNLGYPVDMVMQSGVMMDKITNVVNQTVIQAPQINNQKAPKLIRR